MPCRSDYLEPNAQEFANKRAAKLLIFLLSKKGAPVPTWIKKEATIAYPQDKQTIPLLCKELKVLTPTELDTIVYNAREKQSRQLADWLEEHQEIDRARKNRERAGKKKKELRIQALKKFSKKEIEALELD